MSTYHQHSSTSASSSLSSSSAPLPTSSASSASSLPETVKGVIPSRLQAAFGVTVPSTSRFYDTQDTKTMFGFHTEVTAEYKYPKIIHEHQPYQGWTREIIVDDEGNSKVQFIPPEKLAVEVISDSNSSNSTSSSSSVVSSREIIRSAEELTKYIRSTKVLESCPTLVESSFEFEDLFCVCHRPDEGDYFNCDYGLAGCGSWFHSGTNYCVNMAPDVCRCCGNLWLTCMCNSSHVTIMQIAREYLKDPSTSYCLVETSL